MALRSGEGFRFGSGPGSAASGTKRSRNSSTRPQAVQRTESQGSRGGQRNLRSACESGQAASDQESRKLRPIVPTCCCSHGRRAVQGGSRCRGGSAGDHQRPVCDAVRPSEGDERALEERALGRPKVTVEHQQAEIPEQLAEIRALSFDEKLALLRELGPIPLTQRRDSASSRPRVRASRTTHATLSLSGEASRSI